MATKASVSREDYEVFYPVTTRWKDNDIYGHVNNVTYYSYFDTAANSFLINHCGLDIHHGDIIALVVSSGCEYLAPLAFPDKIDVGIRIDRLGNSSIQYGVGIFKERSANGVAFGHFIHVFVDRVSQRPVRIPDSMRKNLGKILSIKKSS